METLPSIQAAAAVTASAVSANGSKCIKFTYFLAFLASAKNLSCRSSSDVLDNFFSSVICVKSCVMFCVGGCKVG